MSRAGFLIPVFGLAAVLFGWKCYEVWTAPPIPAPVRAGNTEAIPSTAASPPGETKAADLSAAMTEIAVRPLFRPDRQPFHENVAVRPPRNYEGELGRFTVVGVLFLGDTPKAIVSGNVSGRPERYEIGAGEILPGFSVKEVRTDGLLLVADGREFTLPLYAGGPKGAAGPLRTEAASKTGAAGQAPFAAMAPMPGRQSSGVLRQPVSVAPAVTSPAPAALRLLPAPGPGDTSPGGANRQPPIIPGRKQILHGGNR